MPEPKPVVRETVVAETVPPAPENRTPEAVPQENIADNKAVTESILPQKQVADAVPESDAIIPEEEWRQENPAVVIAVVIKDAPVPGRRPEKQMASQEFVEQARRTVLDTYTVMRNDGAPMPAVAKADVSQEKLAPKRMSVADLANDPLASQILEMSPAEVAATLNQITPAAGRQLSRDLNAISKPRIVRLEGERIFKSRQKNLERVYDTAPAEENQHAPAPFPAAQTEEDAPVANLPEDVIIDGERLDLALPFPAGGIDLPEEARENMDNGVIPVLKSREGLRIQIVAFASPTAGKEASARRTALSRALAVRSYLISQGIDATRMDVRALGVQTDPKGAKDKVDLHLVIPKKG
jgi:outer membrane protein OmpA-like peptidoglycan-associated protein